MKSFFLAPMVVALRLPHLISEAQQTMLGRPRGASRPEAERMLTEKITAFREGVSASAIEALSGTIESSTKAMTGDFLGAAHRFTHLPLKIGEAALRPAQAQVRANVRRLAK